MNVLIACEWSARVRDAFRDRGHDAFSCDIRETVGDPKYHIKDDVRNHLDAHWDMLIAFPPCKYLAVSGARWWSGREREQKEALDFVRTLLDSPIDQIALENPIGKISTAIRKPDQIIQPWQFGHGETKATCLWLKNLPLLTPTNVVEGRDDRIHRMPPGPTRSLIRGMTYLGVAKAMAEQWDD